MARKRHKRASYAWAYGLDERLSTRESRAGLRYAALLAETARALRRSALAGDDPPFPLTPADIAFEEEISESTVRRRIAKARRECYGTLSDSAIYARRARARERFERPERVCKAPDCEEKLPRRATRGREYCHTRCRRRHLYQRTHPEAIPAPHLRGSRTKPRDLSAEDLQRIYDWFAARRRQADEDGEEDEY